MALSQYVNEIYTEHNPDRSIETYVYDRKVNLDTSDTDDSVSLYLSISEARRLVEDIQTAIQLIIESELEKP